MKIRTHLTTGQAARLCGVAPRTVSKWCDYHGLNHWRVPGSLDRRIQTHDLVLFLDRHGAPIPPELTDQLNHRVLSIGTDDQFDGWFRGLLPDGLDYLHARAEDGFTAGVLTMTMRPDTVVIDFHMGRRECLQIARCLLLRKAPPRLIALACEDDQYPLALMEYGFESVWKQPVNVALLVEKLRAA